MKYNLELGGFGRSRASRGQAAIFDGITLLLMVGFSCALVYSVVTSYGESMDTALYSFYELNYLQSAVKSLYYMNLQQLSTIRAEGDSTSAYAQDPNLDSASAGCSQFASFTGSVTALDLLKKDLSDDQKYPKDREPVLDDKFSSSDAHTSVSQPGRQAVRCALKEIMKPLVISGYDYYAEVVNPGYKDVPNHAIPFDGARITSNAKLADPLTPLIIPGEKLQTGSGCAFVQSVAGGLYKVLSMDVPLRISLGNSCADGIGCERDYILRVCIWQRR